GSRALTRAMYPGPGEWASGGPPGSGPAARRHGDGREICALLTTAANDLGRPFHERMPGILPLAFHEDGLAPPAGPPRVWQAAPPPEGGGGGGGGPVGGGANGARHEGPVCIQPSA